MWTRETSEEGDSPRSSIRAQQGSSSQYQRGVAQSRSAVG